MKVLGKFKMQAHIISGVVMDSTAFKVSHCVVCDKNATALPAARARSVSIGAMDELSAKVQNASAHRLSHKIHEHTRTATSQFKSIQGGGAMERYTNASTHLIRGSV